jgi:hypothetical protein
MDLTGTDATGDIYYRNAAGVLTRLGIGAAGTTLGVNAGLPSWQPAAQTLSLLNTLSGTTLADTTSFAAANAAGFGKILLVFDRVVPVSAANSIELQVHSGGAFQTTGYYSNNSTTTAIGLTASGQASNTLPGVSGSLIVSTPWLTASPKLFTGSVAYFTTVPVPLVIGAAWNNTAALDGFQIVAAAGALSGGNVKVYGMR